MNTQARSKFAQRLVRERKKRGLSQEALSRRVGYDRSYLAQVESRLNYIPKVEAILALSKELNLTNYKRNKLIASAGFLPPELDGEWPLPLQLALDQYLNRSA